MVKQLEGKSGKEFDKTFLEAMIVHHQQAVDMSVQAKEKASSSDLKKMAKQILSKQKEEINQMRKMLEEIK